MVFHQDVYIPFHFVDGAGILFFGKSTELFHQTYEAWLLASGKKWEEIFASSSFAIPIKHFEVEFSQPVKAGKTYQTQLRVGRIGNSSFVTMFQLLDNGRLCFQTKTTHVFLDLKTSSPLPIPEYWKTYFSEYLL